jgi:hypothetical protein
VLRGFSDDPWLVQIGFDVLMGKFSKSSIGHEIPPYNSSDFFCRMKWTELVKHSRQNPTVKSSSFWFPRLSFRVFFFTKAFKKKKTLTIEIHHANIDIQGL